MEPNLGYFISELDCWVWLSNGNEFKTRELKLASRILNIEPKHVVKLTICLHVSCKFCETLAHAMIKKGLNLTNIPKVSLLVEN